MQIKITGLDALQAKLDRLGKKTLRLATSAAIKDTAFQVQKGIQAEMSTSFDKPDPWAKQSVKVDVQQATKEKQTAVIGFSHNSSRSSSGWKAPGFALHEVHGGGRKQHSSERILRSAGILPAGMFIAPGRGAWLNASGNIPAATMREILTSVKALGNRAYYFNKSGGRRSASRNRYFVAHKAGKAIGIWERLGPHNEVPILIFISAPHYKKRLNFYIVAQNIIFKNWKKNFKARWNEYKKYDIK